MIGSSERLRPVARREVVHGEVAAGRGTVAELAALLNVSPATVRRDLRLLTEQGRATRTYGGAVQRAGRAHPR